MILGAGKMGRAHAEVFRNIAGVELVGVTSRGGISAQVLAEEFSIPHHGVDWQQILLECQPDAAIVAVSHLESEALVSDLITAGVHVLAEKPVALTAEAVENLARRAEDAGVIVMAAMNRRFFAAVQAAIDAAQLHGRLLGLTLIAPDPVRPLAALDAYPADVYRNWTQMNTLHAIDLMCLAAGAVETVMGDAEVDPETQEVSVTAALRFTGGVLGIFVSHSGSPSHWELRLHTTGAEICAAPLERGTVTINGVTTPLPESKDPRGYRTGIDAQARCFVQTLREIGWLPYPASDLRSHAASLRLAEELHALQQAARMRYEKIGAHA